MVLSMAFDRASGPRVAPGDAFSRRFCLVIGAGLAGTLFCACGPTVKPPEPPAEPGPVSQGVKPIKVDPSGRQVMIGEMCPQGAGGRPAVAPLIMRGVGWNDSASEVAATVERGSVPRFFVLGVDGKQAGIFDTLGLVEVGINQPVASGTYVGASPCTYAAGGNGDRAEDPKCGPVTKSCGIAVGEIARPDEAAATMKLDTGGACMSGTEIAVDIDGDGRIESFPLGGALDGIRAPAAEWLASPSSTATCSPTYQIYDQTLTPEPRPGKAPEKATVTIDVLGVIDLDGDGRKELVLAMRFPTVRTIVVYTATESSQRLELAGEATSFAR
jgi:hypothetical protein